MSLAFRCLIPPFAMFAMASAHAQVNPGQPGAAGDRLDAQRTPALQYRSALSGYQVWKDEPATGWREANDLSGRIGGWRAYAKEARQPDPAPAGGTDSSMRNLSPSSTQNSTERTMPVPAGQAGHDSHHGTKQ